jgi:hypothetical protein
MKHADHQTLEERVEAIEALLQDIESKAAIASAAELSWHAKMSLPEEIVFSNAAGEVATLQLGFARTYAAQHRLDATEVVVEGDRILVKEGEEVVASIPKSLWVCLERVLDGCPFLEEDL